MFEKMDLNHDEAQTRCVNHPVNPSMSIVVRTNHEYIYTLTGRLVGDSPTVLEVITFAEYLSVCYIPGKFVPGSRSIICDGNM